VPSEVGSVPIFKAQAKRSLMISTAILTGPFSLATVRKTPQAVTASFAAFSHLA
jgi:hypothetical protein